MAFLTAVTANALAAVSPHQDGEGGCSPTCCKAARENRQNANLSTLCCALDCKQPAGTHSSATNVTASAQRQRCPVAHFVSRLETVLYNQQTRFPDSPTRAVSGSSNRYLETGALLI